MTGTLTKVSGINANNKEVELPSEMNGRKVVKIGNEVFRDNEFITKVILPDTITTIAIRASDGCSNLTEVVLPNGFVSIGEWTFANCTALRSVDLGNLMEISDLVFNFTKSETLTIYCAESEKPDGWDVNWSKANGGVKVEVVWDFNSAAGCIEITGIRTAIHSGSYFLYRSENIIVFIFKNFQEHFCGF